jgi:DNA repair protein RadC
MTARDGIKGLGKAKLAQLLAALELGMRASIPVTREKTFIKSTKQAAEYFKERLSNLSEEHFRVVYPNKQERLIEDTLLAEGTVDSANPYIRTLVMRTLQSNASAIIAAHNHPSGSAEPSDMGRLLTRDIITVCQPLGIKVLDHLIIADSQRFSFADSGLLDEIRLDAMASQT